MENQNIHYDAFISYRHSPLDMFVAETIHRRLEEFKLPKNIQENRPDGKNRIERIFRDRDELPLTSNLSDQIYTALTYSDFLIVICSPRIKESMWCRQEMNKFIELHGHDHILAVLIEGEPEDSFPDEIIYKKVVEKDEFGNEIEKKIPIEPLAADIRGKNKTEMKKKMGEEILRLAAPVFGVRYDDLKQRHRERKIKRIAAISSLAAGIFLIFGLYSGYQAHTIRLKNAEIEKQSQAILEQNEEIVAQNEEIVSQSEKITEQYEKISFREAKDYGATAREYLEAGERELGLNYAYMSVTEDEDGNQLPVTNEGFSALIDSTYAYNTGNYYTPCQTIKIDSEIVAQDVSYSRKYLFAENCDGVLFIFQTASKEMICSIDTNGGENRLRNSSVKNTTVFLNDQLISYMTGEKIVIYDFINQKNVFEIQTQYSEYYNYVVADSSKAIALISLESQLYLFDCNTLKAELLIDLQDEKNQGNFGRFMVSPRICVNSDTIVAIVSGYIERDVKYPFGCLIFSIEQKSLSDRMILSGMDTIYDSSVCDDRLYLLGSRQQDNADNVLDVDRFFACYDLNEHQKVWEQLVYANIYERYVKIYPSVGEKDKRIALYIDQDIYVFEQDTGKIFYKENLEAPVISTYYSGNADYVTVCTKDGVCYYEMIEHRAMYIKQNNFSSNLRFMNFVGGHYYYVINDEKNLHIWSRHKGMRMENTGVNVVLPYQVSYDMERVYTCNYHVLYCTEIGTNVDIWKMDVYDNNIYVFKNDRIVICKGENEFAVIDGKTGEELFDSKSFGDFGMFRVISMDQNKNKMVFQGDAGTIYLFDLNSFEISVLYENPDSLAYISNAAASGDGTYLILVNEENNQLNVFENGVRTTAIDVRANMILRKIVFPSDPYLFVQYSNGTYEVYSLTDGQILYKGEDALATVDRIYDGKYNYPYIFTTISYGNYFIGEDMQAYYVSEQSMNFVFDQPYFTMIYDNKELCIVPYYDTEMLIEDANAWMSGTEHIDL